MIRTLQPLPLLLPVILLVMAGACTDPLSLQTPIRKTTINLDSIVATESFTGAPGDSIFATIEGDRVIFATETQRPIFYNDIINGAHYVTIRATRFGTNGRDYEAMSLRLDGVSDTGTYSINGPFQLQKQINPAGERRFGALYERRYGGYPELYQSGITTPSGTIRVVRLDSTRGVMVGTFSFRGYSTEGDSSVRIEQGAFRLQVKK